MRFLAHWFSSMVKVPALSTASGGAADNFTREDITFKSAGLKLVGWRYVPNGLKASRRSGRSS